MCYFVNTGAKVVGGAVAVPVVVGLAAGAVGIAAGLAVVALPAYGTYRLARKIRQDVRARKAAAQAVTTSTAGSYRERPSRSSCSTNSDSIQRRHSSS